MVDGLDAAAVRRFARDVLHTFESHRAEIDELNVFPIPDGDTGTNLSLTARAGADALAADPTTDAAQALAVLAHGAVLGAVGNSGNILAQLLRSFAEAAAAAGCVDAEALRDGLARGAKQARAAVMEPADGTILTVAQAAADAVPGGAASLQQVVAAAHEAADGALARTPEQLPALAAAGVVDAGGRGFVLLLEALRRTVAGEPEPSVPSQRSALPAQPPMSADGYGYEVQYLLDAEDVAAAALRERLAGLGDSVVVVGTGDGTWNVHAHVDDIGAAIEAGVQVGRPHRISVVRFADEAGAAATSPVARTAVIALVDDPQLAGLFQAEGVHVLAADPPTAADVRAALRAADATDVVVLAAAEHTAAVEDAAGDARRGGLRVAVVPTRSPVQALAAVAVHDASRWFDDDVVGMAEAAAATRFAEVTVATGRSLTSAGICQAGDVLGLIDGEVVEIGHGVLSVALGLTDRLLAVGAELMTVLAGDGAPPGTGATLSRHVHDRAPLTEVAVYPAGQRGAVLVIGAE